MSDHIDIAGVSLLVRSYPAELVDAAIESCGRTEQRRRLLSARLMVYFVLAMALFSPAPYLDVMRRLTSALHWGGLWQDGPLPNKASIFQARERLGSAPLRALFESVAGPAPGPDGGPGGPLLVAEEYAVPLPDGAASPPRRTVAALVDGGTGLVLDAELAGPDPLGSVLRSTPPGSVVLLADGTAPSVDAVLAAAAAGVGLVQRVAPPRLPLQPALRLTDGSFVLRRDGRPWRVIAPDVHTTLLDPATAPADALLERLRGTAGAGTLRDALGGPLISRTAEGVGQELYGRLLVHTALRRSIRYARPAPESRRRTALSEFAG